jgi:hypothetical protein
MRARSQWDVKGKTARSATSEHRRRLWLSDGVTRDNTRQPAGLLRSPGLPIIQLSRTESKVQRIVENREPPV